MTNHHGVVNKVDFKCFTPEGMARQLENYTRGIYKVLEDYQVLYGSAVAMRKAIDSMGAYLIVNCCGGGEVNPVTDGTSDKSNRNPILNRISKEKIRVHSNIYEPDYVVVVDETLLHSVNVTDGLKEEGAIIINTPRSKEEVLPQLNGYKGRVVTIDARAISEQTLGKNFPNTPMLAATVAVTKVLERDQFINDMRASFEHKFAKKPEVIDGNMKALEMAYEAVS